MRAESAAFFVSGPASDGNSGSCERAHDQDLVPVEFHARRVGEPIVREPACEPADQMLLEIVGFSHDSEITSLRTYVKSRSGHKSGLVRFPTLDSLPDDVTPAAYAGSQLSTGLEPPELAYAGLPMPGPDLEAADMAPEDTEIAEAIAAGAEWMTELLARLVDRDTTLGSEEPGQAVMREALLELGLEPVDVRMDPEALRAHPAASPFDWDVGDKSNVVATWSPTHRNGGLSLILNGHIDVVSPEPRSQWDRDPFTAHVEADWLYGRGAADMKCGLAAILGAVKGLRELGLTPHAPVIVQSVVEEECTGNGALQTLLAGYRADAVIIAEPFGAAITTSQVGVLWFDVVIEGLPGHAAEAGHAVNAIEASLR